MKPTDLLVDLGAIMENINWLCIIVFCVSLIASTQPRNKINLLQGKYANYCKIGNINITINKN